jgi:hypothetical protein
MKPIQELEHELKVSGTQQITINIKTYQKYGIYSVAYQGHALITHMEESIRLPACLSGAITVGATDKDANA